MKVNFFNQPYLLYYGHPPKPNLVSRAIDLQILGDVGYFIIIYNEVIGTPKVKHKPEVHVL